MKQRLYSTLDHLILLPDTSKGILYYHLIAPHPKYSTSKTVASITATPLLIHRILATRRRSVNHPGSYPSSTCSHDDPTALIRWRIRLPLSILLPSLLVLIYLEFVKAQSQSTRTRLPPSWLLKEDQTSPMMIISSTTRLKSQNRVHGAILRNIYRSKNLHSIRSRLPR